eukprot:1158701-Pelagomonas_calceolata.AAC.6
MLQLGTTEVHATFAQSACLRPFKFTRASSPVRAELFTVACVRVSLSSVHAALRRTLAMWAPVPCAGVPRPTPYLFILTCLHTLCVCPHAGPPCMQPCGTPLPCGHLCPVPGCHDPPPPAIAPFQQVGAAIVVLGGGEALRTGPLDRGGGLLLRGLGDAGSCELQRAGGGLAVGRQAHTSHPRKASWLTRTSGFGRCDEYGA